MDRCSSEASTARLTLAEPRSHSTLSARKSAADWIGMSHHASASASARSPMTSPVLAARRRIISIFPPVPCFTSVSSQVLRCFRRGHIHVGRSFRASPRTNVAPTNFHVFEYQANLSQCLVTGHEFTRAIMIEMKLGFSHCWTRVEFWRIPQFPTVSPPSDSPPPIFRPPIPAQPALPDTIPPAR